MVLPLIAMMIGVGVVKDSDAVFFQYLGDEQPLLTLLLLASLTPGNVRLLELRLPRNWWQLHQAQPVPRIQRRQHRDADLWSHDPVVSVRHDFTDGSVQQL